MTIQQEYKKILKDAKEPITEINRNDYMNPKVIVPGIGSSSLKGLKEDTQKKLASLADMAKRDRFDQIDSQLKSTTTAFDILLLQIATINAAEDELDSTPMKRKFQRLKV